MKIKSFGFLSYSLITSIVIHSSMHASDPFIWMWFTWCDLWPPLVTRWFYNNKSTECVSSAHQVYHLCIAGAVNPLHQSLFLKSITHNGKANIFTKPEYNCALWNDFCLNYSYSGCEGQKLIKSLGLCFENRTIGTKQ